MKMDKRQFGRPRRGSGSGAAAFVGPAQNPVIRDDCVGNVGTGKARHMTSYTVILLGLPLDEGRRATPISVTFQAPAAVRRLLFLRWRLQLVRVVARDAAQFPRTLGEALAGVHLLDVADRLILIGLLRRLDEN